MPAAVLSFVDMDVVIARQFRGPPQSGNGGYTCGVLAAALAPLGPVEVMLRRPPPLDTALRLHAETDSAELRHGDAVIAEARRAALELVVPPAPDWAAAQAARQRYRGFHAHDFPGCFVCGPERADGDGLRLFTGPLAAERVACDWQPHAAFCDADGLVQSEFLWAAIDCAGFWAPHPRPDTPILLGRFCAAFDARPRAGEDCIVSGWLLGREGRKLHAGSALYRRDGRCIGRARATWIATAPPA